MILGRDTKIVDGNMIEDEEEDLSWRKRQKYVQTCRDAAWKRWRWEYVTALRERHNMQHKSKAVTINVGDVVMIKIKNRREIEDWQN